MPVFRLHLGLELLADRVALIAAEREDLGAGLAHVEADVAEAGARLAAGIDSDRAQRRLVELDEVLVGFEGLRRRTSRTWDATLLELGIGPDGAPGIAELSAMRLIDELLDALILAGLVEAEVFESLGHPRRFAIGVRHGRSPHRGVDQPSRKTSTNDCVVCDARRKVQGFCLRQSDAPAHGPNKGSSWNRVGKFEGLKGHKAR